ncbi:hypothetical protein C1646_752599 [Rhizophagus diaphanus]|nr:hypothetical protein C1646_752599 [Rhizophagus diaphanus] [Rhizophagus sp. MUCL 43196]
MQSKQISPYASPNIWEQESCKCNKNKQSKRTKYPKHEQQIYQRTFKPDSLFSKANKYLLMSITKNDNKVTPSNLSNEKEVENIDKKENHQIFFLVSSDTEEGVNVNDIEVDDDKDSDLEEMKVQIIVKSKNIKVSITKTLNIELASYENIMEKINSVVQKTLRKKVISKDYIVSYKAVNARGPSNELEDESDFQEFIGEYKRVVLSGKKMSMIVMSSDESGFSSAKELLFITTLDMRNKVPVKSSVSVNKNNLTTQTQVSQTVSAIPTPIIIQLPSQLYSNSTFQEQSILCNSNNTNSNIYLVSPNTLLSIGDFLKSLDQKHNYLSDDQLRKLGVNKSNCNILLCVLFVTTLNFI